MEVTVEKTGSFGRKLQVTVPVEQVDQAFDTAYKALAKSVRIPGFRPGKAPRSIIEAHYGPQLRSEVEQSLVSSSLINALQQTEETPVAMPSVDAGDPKRGTEFSYTAEFEVPPEVELERYEGLEIERVEVTVEDEAVQNELEHMREHAAQLVPVMIREEVQKGDVVTMDYSGFIDDVAFPGGTGENAMIEIGGDDYLPGFSESLEGAKVGATVSFPITFPDDYTAEHLAGKTATFKVTIKELKTKEKPALDDDFAKDVGEDDLDALTAKIRAQLQERKQRDADEERRPRALKALVEANPFEVPGSMGRQQAERMVRNAAERMSSIMGPQFELTPELAESLMADSQKDAEFQVRSGLLLLEVAKAAEVEITDDDIRAEVDRIAEDAGEQEERVRAHFSDPDQADKLRFKLMEDRAVAHLLDTSKEIEPEQPEVPSESDGKTDEV